MHLKYLRQRKKVQEMLWGKCVVRNLAMNRTPNANGDPLELAGLSRSWRYLFLFSCGLQASEVIEVIGREFGLNILEALI